MADRPGSRTDTNPYVGLRRFEPSDAHLFFGRDEQAAALVDRLHSSRFVAVVGTSGSGKSSLVRAGLIPALRRGAISRNAGRWRTLIMNPAGAPMANLAAAMRDQEFDVTSLRAHSRGLLDGIRASAGDDNVLVVVDQFEELFRYEDAAAQTAAAEARRAAANSEAHEFVRLLLTTVRSHASVYVVITIRSDYIGDCATFADLPEALTDAQYLVPRLTRDQRRMAIEGPLGGRVDMEPLLVQRILNETGEELDELPVMQHALMRTWRRWHESQPRATQITSGDYEAIGGVRTALNDHADECLESLDAGHIAVAERVFKRLTARGRSQRERRDPATVSQLYEVCGVETEEARHAVRNVVDRFRSRDAAFLTVTSAERKHGAVETGAALSPGDSVDITHESLIRKWHVLSRWVDEEQRSAEVLHELHRVAERWERGHRAKGRAEDDLLRGLVLDDAVRWQQQQVPTSAWAEQYVERDGLAEVTRLIAASSKAETRRSTRRRWVIGGLAAGFLAAVVVAFALYFSRSQVRQQQIEARAGELRLESEALARTNRVDEALLRAVESLRMAPSQAADDAVRRYARLLPETQVLLRPQSPGRIAALSFTRDGRFLVALPEGHELHVWRRDDWKPTARIVATSRIVAFALHPSKPVLGIVDSAGHIAIHDLEDGQLVVSLEPPSGTVTHTASASTSRRLSGIAFDGETHVATAGDNGIVRVWDWQSRKLSATLDAHRARVQHLAFGPDNLLASAGDDGGLWIWNWRDGRKPIRRVHGDVVASVQFASPCSDVGALNASAGSVQVLATGYDGRIRGYGVAAASEAPVNLGAVASFAGEMTTGACGTAIPHGGGRGANDAGVTLAGTALPELLRTVGPGKSTRLALTRHTAVALGDYNSSRALWYASSGFLPQSGAEAARLMHRSAATAATTSWAGGHVVIGTVDGEVVAWSSSGLNGNRSMAVDWNGAIASRFTGSWVAEAVNEPGTVFARIDGERLQWRESSTPAVVHKIDLRDTVDYRSPGRLFVAPNGARAVFLQRGQVLGFDLAGGTTMRLARTDAAYETIQLENDAMLLGAPGVLELYSGDGLQLLGTARFDAQGTALSQAGDHVAAWDDRGAFRIWTRTASGLTPVQSAWSDVHDAVFDRDGRIVACPHGNLAISNPTDVAEDQRYPIGCTRVAAARNAPTIVAAVPGGDVAIIRDGREPEPLPRESSGYDVRALALNPDGSRLGVLLGSDSRVRVFALHGDGVISRLRGDRDRAIALVSVDVDYAKPAPIVFSSDHRLLVAGNAHYLLSADALAREACHRLRVTQQGSGIGNPRDIETVCAGL